MMLFHHFLLYLRSVLPQAQFGEHSDIIIASLPSGEKFVISPLSLWPYVVQVNSRQPFPQPITPIIFSDVAIGTDTPLPKGKWLLSDGRGLTWFCGTVRQGKAELPDAQRERCVEAECATCDVLDNFGGAYALPVV